MPRDYVVDVKRCARCGGDHTGLTFRQMSEPVGGCTHCVECPTTGAVIFMRVVKGRRLGPVVSSVGGLLVGGAIGYSLAGWVGVSGVAAVYVCYLIVWGRK
jgi:hypothetical protein